MNPSANDIATACDAVKAKTVFVLPNNKNIVLAAEKYMQDSGIADTMLILPEFEFYLFDEVLLLQEFFQFLQVLLYLKFQASLFTSSHSLMRTSALLSAE